MSKVNIKKGNVFLIDLTKCTGCRGCMVACKQWNQLQAEETDFFSGEGYQNPRATSEHTFTLIKFREYEKDGQSEFSFYKEMCMHCDDPACVSVCPVNAFVKTPEGPVIYESDRCIGCRFCMIGCPFNMAKYEWSKKLPLVKKCDGCYSRIKEGLEPACVTACPTAIEYGPHAEMLKLAQQRLKQYPDRYIDKIYGKDEAGGTGVFYLTSEPFDALGFDSVSNRALPSYTWPALSLVPGIFLTMGAGLTAMTWITKRREHMEKEKNEKLDKQNSTESKEEQI